MRIWSSRGLIRLHRLRLEGRSRSDGREMGSLEARIGSSRGWCASRQPQGGSVQVRSLAGHVLRNAQTALLPADPPAFLFIVAHRSQPAAGASAWRVYAGGRWRRRGGGPRLRPIASPSETGSLGLIWSAPGPYSAASASGRAQRRSKAQTSSKPMSVCISGSEIIGASTLAVEPSRSRASKALRIAPAAGSMPIAG